MLASAHLNTGDSSLVGEYSNYSLQLNPEDGNAYCTRSLVLANPKNVEQGIQATSKAIRLNPDDPDAYKPRGICYCTAGDCEKSITGLGKAINLNPNTELDRQRLLINM
jgi:tetratricopeptide (TPR) repeat protein